MAERLAYTQATLDSAQELLEDTKPHRGLTIEEIEMTRYVLDRLFAARIGKKKELKIPVARTREDTFPAIALAPGEKVNFMSGMAPTPVQLSNMTDFFLQQDGFSTDRASDAVGGAYGHAQVLRGASYALPEDVPATGAAYMLSTADKYKPDISYRLSARPAAIIKYDSDAEKSSHVSGLVYAAVRVSQRIDRSAEILRKDDEPLLIKEALQAHKISAGVLIANARRPDVVAVLKDRNNPDGASMYIEETRRRLNDGEGDPFRLNRTLLEALGAKGLMSYLKPAA